MKQFYESRVVINQMYGSIVTTFWFLETFWAHWNNASQSFFLLLIKGVGKKNPNAHWPMITFIWEAVTPVSFIKMEKFQCLKLSTAQGLSHGTIRINMGNCDAQKKCLKISQLWLREAFIKKKKCNKCYNGGGGPADKMLQFLKLCLKSISGHSESFW